MRGDCLWKMNLEDLRTSNQNETEPRTTDLWSHQILGSRNSGLSVARCYSQADRCSTSGDVRREAVCATGERQRGASV